MNEQDLSNRFTVLWHKINAQGNPEPIFTKLLEKYREPGRFYHDLNHVIFGLDLFQKVKLLAENREALEFAYWFHDAIYDPRTHDNEEKSAEYANQVMIDAKLPDEFRSIVIKLILATKHVGLETDNDCQVICDLDLAPLGIAPEKFDENAVKIRREYSFIPKDEYVKGRTAVLESLLQRPSIYQTEYFRLHYELRAWENIVVSISWLPYYP